MPRTSIRPLIGVGGFILLVALALGVPDIQSAILEVRALSPNVRQLVKIALVVFGVASGMWGVLE